MNLDRLNLNSGGVPVWPTGRKKSEMKCNTEANSNAATIQQDQINAHLLMDGYFRYLQRAQARRKDERFRFGCSKGNLLKINMINGPQELICLSDTKRTER